MESIVRISLKFLRNATKYNNESSRIAFSSMKIYVKYLGLNIGAEEFISNLFRHNYFLLNL